MTKQISLELDFGKTCRYNLEKEGTFALGCPPKWEMQIKPGLNVIGLSRQKHYYSTGTDYTGIMGLNFIFIATAL
jgi:hypothetical protein